MRLPIFVLATLLYSITASSALACEAGSPTVKDGLIKFRFVICALAGQSADLMKQVRRELINEGVNVADVSCTSVTLGNTYRDAGNIRVAPFNCKIGGKYLMLNGDVLTYDAKARAGPRPRNTRYLMMANPKWSWR